MRDPARTDPLPKYACDGEGALHVVNRFNNSNVDPKWFGGTALAIAYTSDVDNLQPNDLTVISVNHYSVWFRETPYAIPAGLPPCPSGGCLCTWNWIHQTGNGEGYGQEIYNNLYRCTVTGQTNSANKVQRGAVPVDCSTDSSKCVKGPKTPMYLYQASGNNLPDLPVPPNYNNKWGFSDGAQTDIFTPAATAAGAGAAAATATTLPSGWSSMGCYKDQDPRSLEVAMGSSDSQTISGCVGSCAKAGYAYAGIESGKECWCSNEPTLVSAPDSDCKSPCSGDGWSTCGGDWRLSVYKAAGAPSPTASAATVKPTTLASTSIPAGWSAVGCVIDSPTARALDKGSVTYTDNTIAKCIALAESKGLPYAGVEYGSECWTGSSASSNTIKLASADECNVACSGDRATVCGGSYRLNVYVKVGAAASSSKAAASSATAAAVAASSTTTKPSASPATSTATSTKSSSLTSKSATTSAAASTALPSAWTSLGCQADSGSARLLAGWSINTAKNTPQACIKLCADRGWTYAGTENWNQCWCGNKLSRAIDAKGVAGCTMNCAGDPSQRCGGSYKMNLYQKIPSGTGTVAARAAKRMEGGQRKLRWHGNHGHGGGMAVH
jgi:hypothetical protein